jgi:hypothetical protein
MRAFRRRHSLGIVALLALALQAALAFAHTHAHTYAVSGSDGLAQRAITYGMCRAQAERPCAPQAPQHDHAKCPICWSMSLASAAVPHAPPSIPLRHPEIAVLAPAPAAAPVRGVSSVQFQARAPPRA